MFSGYRVLGVCDYLGETFAGLFGITTPRYQREIEEYNRMIKEVIITTHFFRGGHMGGEGGAVAPQCRLVPLFCLTSCPPNVDQMLLFLLRALQNILKKLFFKVLH